MLLRNFIFLLVVANSLPIISQGVKLYEPLHYQEAVDKGTRSRDGKPGPNYWQNFSNYDIEVRLDTLEKRIFGQQTITYFNQSPDTLKNLVLRLYQDKYKKGNIRNQIINASDIHEGMSIDTLVIQGRAIQINDSNTWRMGTNLLINEINPVPPKGSMKLKCRWSYKLPLAVDESRRTGWYKDNAWFIGYFYPQVAVYDDLENAWGIKGWDFRKPHLGNQEFYNDFNNYKVKIEVPEGFYVWATGTLINPNEVFSSELIPKLHDAQNSDKNIQILTPQNLKNDNLKSNVWVYRADNVPDFAFGTSPNYIWDASSVQIGNRRVLVNVAYHPSSQSFPAVLDISKKTLKYASEVYPAIEYPYSSITTFNGNIDAGMEFPMLANNTEETDNTENYILTFHEIFHNYTPFMLGLNEKRYPFMDEGLTEYFTKKFVDQELGEYNFGGYDLYVAYNYFAAQEDNPLINSAYLIDDLSMVYYVYLKPLVAHNLFAEMIGEPNFKLAFQEFANRWTGKHPTPHDFFYTMNDYLNEDYNWFWKAWFFDYGYPDLGLELKGNHLIVNRVGVGSLPLPIRLKIEYSDGTNENIYKPMDVWKNGATSFGIELEDIEGIKSISLDNESLPDVDLSNNQLNIK